MKINIICGDSREEIKNIPDESVDCIISDPPYGMDFQSNFRKATPTFDKIKDDDNLDNVFVMFPEMYRVLKNNTHIYLFCSWHHIDKFKVEFEKYFKLKNILVWNKGGFALGDLHGSYATQFEFILFGHKGVKKFVHDKRPCALIDIQKVNPSDNDHPTQKPVALARELLKHSTVEGDIVLDPYAGTGFVPVACNQLNRDCIAIELEQKYVDKINDKLQQRTL